MCPCVNTYTLIYQRAKTFIYSSSLTISSSSLTSISSMHNLYLFHFLSNFLFLILIFSTAIQIFFFSVSFIKMKAPVLESLLNLYLGLQLYLKKTPTRCFPVKLGKLLKTPILKNICETTVSLWTLLFEMPFKIMAIFKCSIYFLLGHEIGHYHCQ